MVHSLYTSISNAEEKERVIDAKIKDIEEMDNGLWFYKKYNVDLNGEVKRAIELTDEEQKLADLMEKERAEYSQSYETEADYGKYIAARPFYSIKSDIEESRLFTVFKLMPKGGLLHVHSSAALSIEGYKTLLKEWDGEPDHASLPEFDKSPPLSIFVVDGDYNIPGMDGNDSILDNDPIPDGSMYYKYCADIMCAQYADLAEHLRPISFYLAEGAEEQWNKLSALLTLNEDTVPDDHLWKILNPMFIRIDNLFSSEAFYTRYHELFFTECLEDHIEYVELRSDFVSFGDVSKPVNLPVLHEDYSYRNYFVCREMMMPEEEKPVFLDCIMQAVKNVNQNRSNDEKIAVKVILDVRRDLDPTQEEQRKKIESRLDAAIKYHTDKSSEDVKKYNDFVIGFDFVSEEDSEQPTSVFSKEFIYNNVGERQDPSVNLIDFYLHDGESPWANNDDLVHAVVACKYRIGHGFNMALHPGIINNITFNSAVGGGRMEYHYTPQAKLPMLEVCPISNQLLGYFPDMRSHTGYQLMKNGIMCVLGNDDPLMFGNPGLSYDFWMAYVGMGLDFISIKRLVFNSLLPLNGYDIEVPDDAFLNKWKSFVARAYNLLRPLNTSAE